MSTELVAPIDSIKRKQEEISISLRLISAAGQAAVADRIGAHTRLLALTAREKSPISDA
jgi:hypothetical protein